MLGAMVSTGIAVLPSPVMAAKMSAAEKEAKKAARKDENKIKSLTKKLAEVEPFISKNSLSSARTSLEKADKYYNDISEETKKTTEVVDLKKQYDALDAKLKDLEKAEEAKYAGEAALSSARSNYSSFMEQNVWWIAALEMGEAKNVQNDELSDLKKLKESWPAIDSMAKAFGVTFKELIEKDPEYTARGVRVVRTADWIKNIQANRAGYVDGIGRKELDAFVEILKDMGNYLGKRGLIAYHWVDNLYDKDDSKPFGPVAQMQEYYQWAGISLPADKVKAVAATKPTMRKALEKLAAKTVWPNSEFAHQTPEMKAIAKKLADQRGWTLVKVGAPSASGWKVEKNVLGIPLRQIGTGSILLQKKGEPFVRAHKATFIREWDGQKYQPISRVNFDEYLTPHKK